MHAVQDPLELIKSRPSALQSCSMENDTSFGPLLLNLHMGLLTGANVPGVASHLRELTLEEELSRRAGSGAAPQASTEAVPGLKSWRQTPVKFSAGRALLSVRLRLTCSIYADQPSRLLRWGWGL